mgnify:FL=1
MKVILLEDVKKLGKVGDVVEVSDGYARNFLIPRGLGEQADKGKIRALQEKAKVEERRQEKERQEATAIAESLEARAITIKVKTGEQGRLYGSITSMDIANAIEKEFGVSVDKKKVEISEPIKALGSYSVSVRLFPGIITSMKVNVVSD